MYVTKCKGPLPNRLIKNWKYISLPFLFRKFGLFPGQFFSNSAPTRTSCYIFILTPFFSYAAEISSPCRHWLDGALQRKSHLCNSFLGIARSQSQFSHACVCERYSQDWSTDIPAAEKADRSWKYINLSQIYECRNWKTERYYSVFEITVSFLGIHKWEPAIYIGFSPALHLQCINTYLSPLFSV
jgi:hypothetical protein